MRLWERDADAAFGPAAALVGGEQFAVGTRAGAVVVLDAATGRSVGKLSFGASVDGALAADGRTLYVPVARGRAAVVAHDLRAGTRRWAWRPDSAAQTADAGLVLAAGVVVAPLHDGTVVGLDADTGAERWRVAGTPPAQNHAPPALLPGGLVAVADDRGTVRAVDAATGAVRWTAQAGAPVHAAPVHAARLGAAGSLFVPTTRGGLVALDAATGRTLWTARLDPTGRSRVTAPAASAHRVVAGLTDGRVVALDAATGAALWTWAGTGAVVAAPLASETVVYVGTMDARLVALDAATGAETWSAALRGRVKSALAADAGRLVVLSEPRHVTVFAPAAALPAARP